MNVVGGCEPSTGAEGTHFSVYVRSDADLLRSQRSFWFLFGEHRYNASNPKLSRQSNDYQISGEVPALRGTGWGHPHVKVILVAEDADGEETRMEVRGGFTYTDTPAQQNSSYRSPPLSNRKRKASADSVDHISPPKRAITQPIRPKSEDYGPYGYSTSSSAQYAPYVSTSNDRSYVYSAGYDHDAGAQATYQASPRNFSYSYAGPSDLPQTSPATSHGWPAHFPSSESVGILPSPAETHAQNPLLIRTSTLQQVDKGGDGHSNRGPGPGFPHYSMYPNNKAVLKIQGELSEMALHWTSEEWDSGRRLVQFWRQQNGSTIHATFRPVPQSDRPSANTNTICVSCIWWAERKECYVTSVDCIYLLESLIGVRFTVEEKNRIRRNLEGFRPLTVSKGKKECESFFKLIMQFPSPKPRNIEKDVKVFAWSILPHALKKIIGKYVCDPVLPL